MIIATDYVPSLSLLTTLKTRHEWVAHIRPLITTADGANHRDHWMQLRRMSATRRGTVNNDERNLGSPPPTAANVVPSPPHPLMALAAMMTQRTEAKERRQQEMATKKQSPPLPLPLPSHEAQQLAEKTEATKRMIRVASMMKSDTHLQSSQIVPPVALAKFMLLVSIDTQHVIGMNDHNHGREMTAHLGVHHITTDEANKVAMYFTDQVPYDAAVAWVIATKSEELEKHIARGCPYPFCVEARSERGLPPLVAAATGTSAPSLLSSSSPSEKKYSCSSSTPLLPSSPPPFLPPSSPPAPLSSL